jgi:hypothetical protein
LTALGLLAAAICLQTAGQPSRPARLEAVGWLAGHWIGEGLGGVGEEIWSEPGGGVMLGLYRHLVRGKLTFFEVMMIAEERDTLVLKLKHFGPDFNGWEPKDEHVAFPLIGLEPRAARFDGLDYLGQEDGSLRILLKMKSPDGNVREEEFRMKRLSPAGAN